MTKDELIDKKLAEIFEKRLELADDIPLKGKATFKGMSYKAMPDSKLRELIVNMTIFVEKYMILFPYDNPLYDLEDANIIIHNCWATLKNRDMDNKRAELLDLEAALKTFVSDEYKLAQLINKLDSIN